VGKEIAAYGNGKDILNYDRSGKFWFTVKEPTWSIYSLYVIDDKHAIARKAYALGKPIEFSCPKGNGWTTIKDEPAWFDDCEYRPKEEWKPKMGDTIMVSSYYKPTWEKAEFICMTKRDNRYICHSTCGYTVSIWGNAKEISDEKATVKLGWNNSHDECKEEIASQKMRGQAENRREKFRGIVHPYYLTRGIVLY